MKLVLRKKTAEKTKARLIKRARIRKKVIGRPERLRVSVFKSLRGIYLQLIDDTKGHTLFALDTRHVKQKPTVEGAKVLGMEFGKKIVERGWRQVVFDRGGYPYHGKVKAIAEGIREAGVSI
ncbi:MAG: 50S ribosomal protein L18 [Bdellovibrionaceae bacterium]|nr:50S ribosomal protein L18 [Pseudobdellovibrionaceae bacterium]MDW8190888.1 50S ribosomal protein L18 [Pseudobdellovibrionaceae bacterium]